MKSSTTNLFGPAILRQAGARSSIFDLWLADLSEEERGPSCIVRRLLPPYSLGAEYLQMYEARLEEIRRFDHPASLVPAYWGIEAGIPYSIQDLPSGWNLQELLSECFERRTPLPPDLVLQIAFPGAHVLASAHARPGNPLVHGAVRPSAFWLEADGRTRLADFDIGPLSEFELRGSDTWQLNGWRCAAPERAHAWANPQPAVDVYSFGAVCLEMLCVGRLSEVQYQSELGDRLALLMSQGLPVPLLKLLAACHAEAPDMRPSMVAVADGLKELGKSLPRSISLVDFLSQYAPARRDITHRSNTAQFKALLKGFPKRGFLANTDATTADAANSAKAGAQGRPTGSSGGGRLRLYGMALMVLLGVGGAVAFKQGKLSFSRGPELSLTVSSRPEGAQIYTSEGSLLGFAPLSTTLTAGGSGDLTLEARMEGFQSKQLTQNVPEKPAPGQVFAFEFLLEPQPGSPIAAPTSAAKSSGNSRTSGERPRPSSSNTGYLKVLSSPAAEVYLNGNPHGSSGPDLKVKLPAGRQSVELAEIGGSRHASYEARIEAGQTLRLAYDFGSRQWRIGTETETGENPSNKGTDGAGTGQEKDNSTAQESSGSANTGSSGDQTPSP